MLFANRKLTGGAEPIIKKYIAEKTGLKPENIAILGIDDLDKWLAKFQFIVNMVNLTKRILEIVPGCVLISVIAPYFVTSNPADFIAIVITLLAASYLSLLPTVIISIVATGLLRMWMV